MIGKRAIAVAAGLVLILAATAGLALSHGFGGREGDGHEMWLLARAAGLNHSQIASAFENNAKEFTTDRANLKAAHEAMMSCLLSRPRQGCASPISSFSRALQTMAQNRMTVWQNLFKSAPNLPAAANVYTQLQQLHAQKKQIFQSVFGSPDTEGGSSTNDASPNG